MTLMFTGIIRHVGVVKSTRPAAGGLRLAIDAGPLAEGLGLGDSIAVNGACLTAADISGPTVEMDVMAESVARTTLGDLRPGGKANLERPMTLGGTLDGHMVQGHVDGTATVKQVRRGEAHVVEFTAAADLTAQMVPKGSVAVDGVSLTLVDVSPDGFSVALIPTTLADTTLGALSAGSKVNVETDVIGKYVLKHLRQMGGAEARGGPLTLEKLTEAGFI